MPNQIDDYLLCSIDLTNKCNLACPYCYKETEYYDTQGSRDNYIDIQKEKLYKLYYWVLGSKYKTNVCFQFHGGEPLIKWDLITWFIKSVSNLTLSTKTISFGIQTNGILLTKEKIDWLYENKVNIGVSFDGTRSQQDKNRPRLNGKSSYDSIVTNFKYLLEKFPETSCQVTVDEPQSVVDSLINLLDLGFKNTIFSPVYSKKSESKEWQNEMALNHISLAKKIISLNKSGSNIVDNSIKRTLKSFAYGNTGFMCHSWPCGAGSKLIAIDVNGFVYPCDVFFDGEGWSYGNIDQISELPFDEVIFSSKITNTLVNRTSDKVETCSTCSTKNSCGGGCPGITLKHKNNIFEPDIHCNYLHKFHSGIEDIITEDPLNIIYLMDSKNVIYEK